MPHSSSMTTIYLFNSEWVGMANLVEPVYNELRVLNNNLLPLLLTTIIQTPK